MDCFNIEKCKIYLKHEPGGKFWDTNVGTYGNFSSFIQDTDIVGLFQVMFPSQNLHYYFLLQ